MFDLSSLNKNQLKAVTSGTGPSVVVAGAGTGKTRVLTSRVIYLITEMGIKPWEILALTFTNKAANEMRNRIFDSGGENIGWIGTYSATCLRILKQEIELLDRSTNFTVIDEEDQLSLIKEIYRENNLDTKKTTPKKVQGHICNIKNSQTDILQFVSYDVFKKFHIFTTDEINIVKFVYKRYQQRLLQENLLDFDDLLLLTLEIFEKFPEARTRWQQKFKYILVDEFQDTNKIQFEILMHLINPEQKNIFVVGDPDQTIYTWRGAYPQIFEDFYSRFPTTKTYILDLNYRSTKKILSLSNNLIKNNQDRVKKELVTNNSEGEHVIIYRGKSQDDEANYVSKQIKMLVEEKKYKYSDIAILYRANYLSRNIESALINSNIPYYLYGGVKFYQRKEIKDILAYLRLLVNDNDELSLKRVLNVPKRSIGQNTIEKISDYANSFNMSFGGALKLSLDLKNELPWSVGGIINFYKFLNSFSRETTELKISDRVKMLIEKLNYNEYLKSLDIEFGQRLENINELINSIIKYEEANPNGTISNYLQEISLYTSATEQKLNRDTVSLMTIHTAKGSEYRAIFVIGMNEGVFPSMSFGKQNDIEEERRIAYVAMTRAREILYLTSASGFSSIKQQPLTDSRFLKEIGNNNITYDINRAVTLSDLSQDWFNSQTVDYSKNILEEAPEIFIGDTIVHTILGEGLVVDKKANYIDVLFKHPYGKKTLLSNHKNVKRKL